MKSLEQNRKNLYQSVKDIVDIKLKNGKSYKLSKIESTYGYDYAYEYFKKIFFSSESKNEKNYPGVNGLRELIKKDKPNNKELYKNTTAEFFQEYACDLPLFVSNTYCLVDCYAEDYAGTYKYGNETALIYGDVNDNNEPVIKIYINKKYIYFLECYSQLNLGIKNESNKEVGFLIFKKNDSGKITEFTLDAVIGTNVYEDKLFIREGSTSTTPTDSTQQTKQDTTVKPKPKPKPKPQQTTSQPQQTTPQPQQTTPQPSRGRYVGKNDIWRIGDRNELIKKLNDRYDLTKKYNDVLSKELISLLFYDDLISRDEYKDGIIGENGKKRLRDRTVGGFLTDADFLNENILLKKVIKESVRRNLKDIYYGT